MNNQMFQSPINIPFRMEGRTKKKKKKNQVEIFAIFQTDEYLDLATNRPADNR